MHYSVNFGAMERSDEAGVTPERQALLNQFPHMDPDQKQRAIYNAVSMALSQEIERFFALDDRAVIDTLDFALRELAARSPDFSLSDDRAQREAETWARYANASEIAHYGTACLRNVPEKTMHPGLLRRVLSNVWRRLDVTDRRRFLERVANENKQGSNRA